MAKIEYLDDFCYIRDAKTKQIVSFPYAYEVPTLNVSQPWLLSFSQCSDDDIEFYIFNEYLCYPSLYFHDEEFSESVLTFPQSFRQTMFSWASLITSIEMLDHFLITAGCLDSEL